MKVDENGSVYEFDPEEYSSGGTLFVPKNARRFDWKRMRESEWFCVAFALKEKIVVEESNPVFYMQDGCLIDRNTKTLILAEIGATLPQDGSIRHINDYAFIKYSSGGEVLRIPDGVIDIGEGAFLWASSFREIFLPASLREIAPLVFEGDCDRVTVDERNADYYAEGGCLVRRRDGTVQVMFGDEISVPNGIGSVEVYRPQGLKAKRITISASVEKIAYMNFASIREIAVDKDSPYFYVEDGCLIQRRDMRLIAAIPEDTVIPQGVRVIDWNAFEGRRYRKIVIPESVTEIDLGAIGQNTGKAEIVVKRGSYADQHCERWGIPRSYTA